MLPDRVSNPGPLTYESGTLPTALRGSAGICCPPPHLYMGEFQEMFFLYTSRQYLYFVKHIH